MSDFSGSLYQYICFFHCVHEQECVSTLVINNDSHLIHVLQGTGQIRIGQEQHAIGPGCVTFIPSFTPYQMVIHPYFEMMNFHFRLLMSDGSPWDTRYHLPPVFRPEKFSVYAEQLREMKQSEASCSEKRFQAAAISHSIVAEYLSGQSLYPVQIPGLPDPRVRKVEEQLRTLSGSTFSATAIARTACLSISQLNRQFKRQYGTSPRKYWQQIRFHEVCEQLQIPGCSLQEIADHNGFCDPYHLSKWFKQISGLSPRQYRKKHFLI